jgi:hypothetical protein
MSTFAFNLAYEDDIIIVNATIEGIYKFRLALDTAATHTTIDSNMLFFAGYQLKNSIGEKEVETSNGIIIVELYSVRQLECLGIIHNDFEVQVYDFLSHGISSEYDGVVGLNFFRNEKLCIDFFNNEVSVHPKL